MPRNGPNGWRLPGAWEGGKPPPVVHEYADWLVSLERTPPTKAKWADEHGLNVNTLYNWEKDDRVKKLISDKADKANMSPDRVQSVINALYKAASSGDTKAASLYLAHVDKVMPRKPAVENSLDKMSDEELRAELALHVSEE